MNNPQIEAAVNSLNSAIGYLAVLSKQLSAPAPFVLAELQTWDWELLWGVGRSHPVDNPSVHGHATFLPGHPAVLDFHPVIITNDRDNLYALKRLAPRIPNDILVNSTKFRYAFTLAISDPTAPEAYEFEVHKQVTKFTWNMALQIKRIDANTFGINYFDYSAKVWKPSGATFPETLLASSVHIVAEFTTSLISTTHDRVTVGNDVHEIGVTQAVTIGESVKDPFINIAHQPDANGIAKPYQVRLEGVSLTLA